LGGKDDALVVGQVFPGGGAAAAGMRPGDAIVSIDGAPVTAIGFADSIQKIRGPEGSVVRLGVRRDGESVLTPRAEFALRRLGTEATPQITDTGYRYYDWVE